jgi:FkbM family methyltransferase
MIDLIETIEGQVWSAVDRRIFEHEGCVIDVGCLRWDWSDMLIGTKRVIGVDPIEPDCPPNAELFRGLLGPNNCKVRMNPTVDRGDDKAIDNSLYSLDNDSEYLNMISWKSFCEMYSIDNISVLKINIEGSEYALLNSMDASDYRKIDQIVISFHHWLNPEWGLLTEASLNLLRLNGFDIIKTYSRWGWYLALKNR